MTWIAAPGCRLGHFLFQITKLVKILRFHDPFRVSKGSAQSTKTSEMRTQDFLYSPSCPSTDEPVTVKRPKGRLEVVILNDYTFKTEGLAGTVKAYSFKDALLRINNEHDITGRLKRGAWAWVEDPEDGERIYLGKENMR